jgi:hypothetical protein
VFTNGDSRIANNTLASVKAAFGLVSIGTPTSVNNQIASFGEVLVNQDYIEQVFDNTSSRNVVLNQPASSPLNFETSSTLTGIVQNSLSVEGDPNIKMLAGVIRNTGGTWSFLNDADHVPLRLTSISQPSSSIVRIGYDKTYPKVISLLVVPDETYTRNGVIAGASVGLSDANIELYQNKTVNGYIRYDGSGWVASGGNVTNITYASGTGLLTFNHPELHANDQFGLSLTPRQPSAYVYYGGSAGTTSQEVYIYNPDGTPYTGAPNTDMRFYFGKTSSGLLEHSQSAISGSNLWIFGLMLD